MAVTFRTLDAIRGLGVMPLRLPDPPATDRRPESVIAASMPRARGTLLSALSFQASADIYSASYTEPTFNRYGIPTLATSFYGSLRQAGLNGIPAPSPTGTMSLSALQLLLNPSPFGTSYLDMVV